jgi:hypothetical protein
LHYVASIHLYIGLHWPGLWYMEGGVSVLAAYPE